MNKKFSQTLILLMSICFSVPSYSTGPESMEDLLYTTLRVTCKKVNSSVPFSVGTGYIYDFLEKDPDVAEYNNGKYSVISTAQFVRKPYLVTNKHVIKGADFIELTFHLTKDGKVPVGTYKIPLGKLNNTQGVLPIEELFGKLQNVDICAYALSDVIRFVEDNLNRPREKEYRKKYKVYKGEQAKHPNVYTPPPLKPEKLSVFYKSLSKKNLVNFETEEAIKDIIMVGYPWGLANESTNLPIIRKGITASSIKHNFQLTPVASLSPDILLDVACFPGSSGSPAFIYQADGTKRKPFKVKLLGTNYATYNPNNSQSTPIPTERAELIPSNLAIVIKSTVLQEIQKLIEQGAVSH